MIVFAHRGFGLGEIFADKVKAPADSIKDAARS